MITVFRHSWITGVSTVCECSRSRPHQPDFHTLGLGTNHQRFGTQAFIMFATLAGVFCHPRSLSNVRRLGHEVQWPSVIRALSFQIC